jgi:hypothetical protein
MSYRLKMRMGEQIKGNPSVSAEIKWHFTYLKALFSPSIDITFTGWNGFLGLGPHLCLGLVWFSGD